jgi:hypothetical protein
MSPEERLAVKAVALTTLDEATRSLVANFDPMHAALRPVLERFMREGTLRAGT